MCVKGIVLEGLDRILVARDKDRWTQDWIVRFHKISCWKLAYQEGPFYLEFVCFLVNIDCSGIGHKQGAGDSVNQSVKMSVCQLVVGQWVYVSCAMLTEHTKEKGWPPLEDWESCQLYSSRKIRVHVRDIDPLVPTKRFCSVVSTSSSKNSLKYENYGSQTDLLRLFIWVPGSLNQIIILIKWFLSCIYFARPPLRKPFNELVASSSNASNFSGRCPVRFSTGTLTILTNPDWDVSRTVSVPPV
jgi:hypothetical protein